MQEGCLKVVFKVTLEQFIGRFTLHLGSDKLECRLLDEALSGEIYSTTILDYTSLGSGL